MSPDGPKSVSPEEKLLNLIRGKAQGPAPAQGSRRLSPSSRSAWQLPSWWLTAVNLGLGALVMGELVMFVLLALRPAPTITASLPPPALLAPPPHQPPEEPMPSLASTVSQPLFESADRQDASRRSGPQAPSEQAKAFAARLSLIGIVSGEPAQAIIQDAQTQKTYFVSVGQHVVEGLIVEEIRANHAVLNFQGEKIELSL